jgi:hypothetical protein
MATKTPEDFRDRALECERRALTAQDPKMWLNVASGWRAVAIAEEAAQSPIAARDPVPCIR